MPTREGIEISEEDAILYDQYNEEADYHDRLQYVFKIKLNSLYGALTNLYFRFYRIEMGESTTATGRMILKHQCRTVNQLLGGSYDVDFPIYLQTAKAIKAKHTAKDADLISLDGSVFKGKYQSTHVVYGDSVAGDSVIITDQGNKRIEDLFTSVYQTIGDKEYCNLTGVKALAYDRSTNTNVMGEILYVMRHKTLKQLYRVHISNTAYVDVTEDHSLIVDSINDGIHEQTAEGLVSDEWLMYHSQEFRTNTGFQRMRWSNVEKLDIKEQYVYDIEVAGVHTFYANGILVHNTDSVSGKSHVDVDGEKKPIEEHFKELAEDNQVVTLENGVELLMLDGACETPCPTDEGWDYAPVNLIYRHKTKKRRFKITTSSGKEVIVTEDHSIMRVVGTQLEECKPLEMKIGDVVIEQRRK